MTNNTIRTDLEQMLDKLDNLGEFGAACFVSMAIDALGGSRSAAAIDEDLPEAPWSNAAGPSQGSASPSA